MSDSNSIKIHRVSKIFGQDPQTVRALNDVSIEIRDGEFFTLLGPSGCGKTTLLRLIAGFEHPTRGQIELHGEEISHLPPFRRPVNTVFQSYALFPHMTVAENIGFGLEMQGKSKAEIRETVASMLSLVQMASLAERRTDQISGGQQQRVALARALAPKPSVLLLDEPLSALDYKLRKGMQLELKRLQHETRITFVFVTHDQEEALTMSDRIAVMNEGRILQIGAPREIYARPAVRFVANFIGDTNFLPVTLAECQDQSSLLVLPSGKKIRAGAVPQETREKVQIAIRPEQTRLTRDCDQAHLSGKVVDVVYSGTDTHYHLALSDQSVFVVRMQNHAASDEDWQEGQQAGILINPGAVQVLID